MGGLSDRQCSHKRIPIAIKFNLYGDWYKGRDYAPRKRTQSPQGAGNVRGKKEQNSAKAPRSISEEGETRSVSAARQKTAKKVSIFFGR